MAPPGLIVAAPASGSGKTLFVLGLIRHWAAAGVAVASAKVGPDYIDPAFHSAAGGRACISLDAWAMAPAQMATAALAVGDGAEVIVCEGVMGLFDGATATSGSTADVAAAGGWPVVLVVDVRGQAASAAAVVRGFAAHRSDVGVAAVVFNRVGSDRHAAVLHEACAASIPEIRVAGCLPFVEGLRMPERHLGLVQAAEHVDLEDLLDRAAAWVAAHVDVAALRRLARPWRDVAAPTAAQPMPLLAPLGQRIAVADDVAFGFRYALVMEGWRGAGAEIRPFSPLADEAPAADADAVYLPGGYPELFAGRLAGNRTFMAGLREAAARDATIFGECGGYMVMGRGLTDADGVDHAMAGLLPVETSFANRRLHLGYRRAVTMTDSRLGPAGRGFRGHEFHYARVVREGPGQPLFRCSDAAGRDIGPMGLAVGRVLGSFVHLIAAEMN